MKKLRGMFAALASAFGLGHAMSVSASKADDLSNIFRSMRKQSVSKPNKISQKKRRLIARRLNKY